MTKLRRYSFKTNAYRFCWGRALALLTMLSTVLFLIIEPPLQAALTNSVPFDDDFESYLLGTPLIDGTNGWYASDTNVQVQADVVYSGTQAARITTDSYLTNRFDTSYTSNSSVWVEMYLQPALFESMDFEPVCDSDVAASFYVNSAGHFVARNAGGWQAFTNTVFGAEYAVSSEWVRVNCWMDYQNRKWWLFLNNILLASDLDFADTAVDSLSAMDVYNGATTTYMDNVTVTGAMPVIANLVDLQVNVTSIYRSVREGNNAANAVFELWNSKTRADGGYYLMDYSNTVDYGAGPTNWINVAPVTGAVYGNRAAVTISFNTVGLPVSTNPYTAIIRVSGEDGQFGWPTENIPREIAVELLVRSVPELRVDPLELRSEANWSGTATPDELRVANIGAPPRDAMGYTISVSTLSGGEWLLASPASGVSTGETDVISVSYASSALDGGIYAGLVTVASDGADGSPQDIPVYLRVNHEPVLAWDMEVIDPGLSAEVQEGETLESRYFHIWNDSAEPVGRMRFEVNLSDELRLWITNVTPAIGVSSGETHRVTVEYDTADLAAGVYGGTLTVRGIDDWSGACVCELTANPTLNVVGRAALRVESEQLAGQVLQNLSATNFMRIWNGSGEPRRSMRYQITTGLVWLDCSPPESVVHNGTATVSVVFNSGTFAPGEYTGEITIDAWDTTDGMRAIGAPLVLPASLAVLSRTPYNFEPPEITGNPYIGQSLLAWPGLWKNMDRLRFEYQWERAANTDGAGRTVIKSWSSTTNYQVAAADRGMYLRVLARATDDNPSPLSTVAYSAFRQSKIKAMPGDFDGDGRTDLWFFNPANGMWHAYLSTGASGSFLFGAPGMTAVPGDYDGNGWLDLGVYDRVSGMWHVMLLPQWQYASGWFGWADAVAMPGDYNGDGTTDLAVYWAAGGRWYIYYVNTGSIEELNFGGPGKSGVPGDYDGDGIIDPAVYDAVSGQWLVRGSRDGDWSAFLGGSGAVPAPGDYDGDGKTDIAVYWPSSNLWRMRLSGSGVTSDMRFGVSNGAGVPRPGYYDRDNLCDPAHAHIYGDFIIWSVRLTEFTNYFDYRGQSYQISTDFWRVSW